MASVEILGVHEVAAPEPCHLVEVLIRDCDGPLEVGRITQADQSRHEADWQVPYDEKLLNENGTEVAHDLWEGSGDETLWSGQVRVAFFFHYLDLAKPLRTPLGDVVLPPPSPRPQRLAFLEYQEP